MTTREWIEICIDDVWYEPVKVNDHRHDQGWVGYRLADKRVGVALRGEWRVCTVEHSPKRIFTIRV